MGGLFNWRTILRGVLITVGTWLTAMPCPEPGADCLTRIIGAALVMLGGSLGSSPSSVKAGKAGTGLV